MQSASPLGLVPLAISPDNSLGTIHGSSEAGLGADLGAQMLGRPKLFMVVGGALIFIGFVPGFPMLVFGAGGAVVAGGGWFLSNQQTAAAVAVAAAPAVVAPALPALGSGTDSPMDALRVETMELEVGYGLVGLVEGGASGGLVERIGLIRRQIAGELGLVVPTVRIRDDLVLEQNAYVIKLRGSEIARGTVDPTKMLCMDPNGGEIAVSGIPTTEPVFGLPASWVSIADRERAESLGYTVVDAASVLATHLAETIRRHAHEILGRPETNQLLESLKRDQPGLVEELVPNLVSTGDVEKVLQGLLRERVPIRDLSTILESIGDGARSTKEPLFLTEAVRHALSRAISMRYRAPDGAIHAVALAPDLDTRLGTSVMVQPGYVGLELSGSDSRLLIESIDRSLKTLALQRYQPILLCTTRIRLALRNLTERHMPQLTVLSYEEILPSVSVQVHAQVEV